MLLLVLLVVGRSSVNLPVVVRVVDVILRIIRGVSVSATMVVGIGPVALVVLPRRRWSILL